jgi:hypothetical protein
MSSLSIGNELTGIGEVIRNSHGALQYYELHFVASFGGVDKWNLLKISFSPSNT